jgi:SP family myo-inositol transporter-like MFS transporter 13
MAILQLPGFNTIMYYSATLFKIVGFSNATAVAVTVSATNFIFSIMKLDIVEILDRHRILLVTIAGISAYPVIGIVLFHPN